MVGQSCQIGQPNNQHIFKKSSKLAKFQTNLPFLGFLKRSDRYRRGLTIVDAILAVFLQDWSSFGLCCLVALTPVQKCQQTKKVLLTLLVSGGASYPRKWLQHFWAVGSVKALMSWQMIQNRKLSLTFLEVLSLRIIKSSKFSHLLRFSMPVQISHEAFSMASSKSLFM